MTTKKIWCAHGQIVELKTELTKSERKTIFKEIVEAAFLKVAPTPKTQEDWDKLSKQFDVLSSCFIVSIDGDKNKNYLDICEQDLGSVILEINNIIIDEFNLIRVV